MRVNRAEGIFYFSSVHNGSYIQHNQSKSSLRLQTSNLGIRFTRKKVGFSRSWNLQLFNFFVILIIADNDKTFVVLNTTE